MRSARWTGTSSQQDAVNLLRSKALNPLWHYNCAHSMANLRAVALRQQLVDDAITRQREHTKSTYTGADNDCTMTKRTPTVSDFNEMSQPGPDWPINAMEWDGEVQRWNVLATRLVTGEVQLAREHWDKGGFRRCKKPAAAWFNFSFYSTNIFNEHFD